MLENNHSEGNAMSQIVTMMQQGGSPTPIDKIVGDVFQT